MFNKEIIVTVAPSSNFWILSHKIYNEHFLSINFKFKIALLSFVVEAIDDFAGLLTAEKRNLSDQEKFQLLTKDYTPSEKFVFPKTKIYGKCRSFQMSWLKEYKWLVYSPSSIQRRGPLSGMSPVSTEFQHCEHGGTCEFRHDKI